MGTVANIGTLSEPLEDSIAAAAAFPEDSDALLDAVEAKGTLSRAEVARSVLSKEGIEYRLESKEEEIYPPFPFILKLPHVMIVLLA